MDRQRQKNNSRSCCCSCCCPLISISITLILVLANIWTKPRCTIELFDVSTLHKSPNSTSQTNTISYDIQLEVKNKLERGVYYDALDLAFYYNSNSTANASHPGFYQKRGHPAHLTGHIDAPGVKWENGAVFVVKLATKIRYQLLIYRTKRHRFRVQADLKVNDKGDMVKGENQDGIRLTSSSATKNMGSFDLVGKSSGLLGFFVVWFVFVFV